MKIFDISQPFVFAKDRQHFGGKAVKKGSRVPAGFSRQQLERFCNAGIIEPLATQLPTDPPPARKLDEPVVVTEPVLVGEPVLVAEPVAPTETDATQLPKDPPPATTAKLDHTGAGWYNIVVEGLGAVNADKLKGREAALQWAAENNYLLAVDGE